MNKYVFFKRKHSVPDSPDGAALPFPPMRLRKMVGPLDEPSYDNPSGLPIWGDLAFGPLGPGEAYEKVFDFGCGCGRNARQLLMQKSPPSQYVGIDVSAEMVEWCRRNLRRAGVDVLFDHHDVWSPTYAPRNSRRETLPLRKYGSDFTLLNAHSVFTHLFERQTEFYLAECKRLVSSLGIMRTTWFFFNEDWFPVLAPSQHTIFVNDTDPSQAVYYGWRYFTDLLRRLELKVVHVVWTRKPGFQSEVYLASGERFEDIAGGLQPPETILGFGPGRPPPFSQA